MSDKIMRRCDFYSCLESCIRMPYLNRSSLHRRPYHLHVDLPFAQSVPDASQPDLPHRLFSCHGHGLFLVISPRLLSHMHILNKRIAFKISYASRNQYNLAHYPFDAYLRPVINISQVINIVYVATQVRSLHPSVFAVKGSHPVCYNQIIHMSVGHCRLKESKVVRISRILIRA